MSIVSGVRDRGRGSSGSDREHAGPAPLAHSEQIGVERNGRHGGGAEPLARALGWFSLGLGLAQIMAPRKVAQLIGVDGDDTAQSVMRVVGLREIASGIGILAQAKSTPWLWARLGGDAMDLALLGSAMASPTSDKNRVATATAAVLGIAAVDALASKRMTGEPDATSQAMQAQDVHVAAAITVRAPIEEVFAAWEGFQQLPRFMSDAASVLVTGDRQSRWSVTGPAGVTLAWDVEITESAPNEQITWQAAPGAPIVASGAVRFRIAPGDRGTEVVFDARFSPPGGQLGKTLMQPLVEIFGTKLGNDLRRFKQLVELREIVHSDDSIIPGPNPAQPPAAIPPDVTTAASAT